MKKNRRAKKNMGSQKRHSKRESKEVLSFFNKTANHQSPLSTPAPDTPQIPHISTNRRHQPPTPTTGIPSSSEPPHIPPSKPHFILPTFCSPRQSFTISLIPAKMRIMQKPFLSPFLQITTFTIFNIYAKQQLSYKKLFSKHPTTYPTLHKCHPQRNSEITLTIPTTIHSTLNTSTSSTRQRHASHTLPPTMPTIFPCRQLPLHIRHALQMLTKAGRMHSTFLQITTFMIFNIYAKQQHRPHLLHPQCISRSLPAP